MVTRRLTLAAAALVAALATACGGGSSAGSAPRTQPSAAVLHGAVPVQKDARPSFTLVDTSGHTYDFGARTRGRVTMLYFGYTHCPDECPTTLANLATALHDLGPRAKDVRVLFVSVDPARDSLPILKAYVSTFAPQIDGLRGTDDEIAALARRYRVLYAVTPDSSGQNPTVMHSDSTFFFDRDGRARLVTTDTNDTKAIEADIRRLLSG